MNREISAIILAAGKSTRLYPLTLETPKVLLPVAGRPMIDWTIGWLRQHGITRVAINLHHLSEKVDAYLGDGARFGIQIKYSREEELLGTSLGAKVMSKYFAGLHVIIYGDVLCDFDLTRMIEFHRQHQALATLALFPRVARKDVGGVSLDAVDRINDFKERIADADTGYDYANGGIYVVEQSLFDMESNAAFSDFGNDLLPALVKKGFPIFGYRLSAGDYLLDMGTSERYRKVNEDALSGKVKVAVTA
jgi:NDP-sugar pyrophosphorylase family protein